MLTNIFQFSVVRTCMHCWVYCHVIKTHWNWYYNDPFLAWNIHWKLYVISNVAVNPTINQSQEIHTCNVVFHTSTFNPIQSRPAVCSWILFNVMAIHVLLMSYYCSVHLFVRLCMIWPMLQRKRNPLLYIVAYNTRCSTAMCTCTGLEVNIYL